MRKTELLRTHVTCIIYYAGIESPKFPNVSQSCLQNIFFKAIRVRKLELLRADSRLVYARNIDVIALEQSRRLGRASS